MKPRFAGGLRARLMLLVALALVPAFALTAYAGVEARELKRQEVLEDNMRFARLAAVDSERLVEASHLLLIGLSRVPEVQYGGPERCGSLLGEMRQEYPSYANLGVVDLSGNVTCSAIPMSGPMYAGDRAYFQDAVERQAFAVGEYQIGRITGRPTLNFGYPVRDDAGNLRGVVFAALDLAWLSDRAAQARLPEGSTLTLFDASGTILARHPEPEAWVGRQLPDAEIVRAAVAGEEGVAEAPGLDGVERLYAFVSLDAGGARQRVFVGVGVPRDAVFAQTDAIFARNLAALLGAAVLATVAVWIVSDRAIVRPVNATLGATRRMARGELSARTGLPPGPDELSALGHAFDEMAAALERQHTELKEVDRLKTRILNTAAHELNTPITPVKLQIHLLRTVGAEDLTPRQQRSLEILDRNVNRLAALVHDILDVARLQGGRLKVERAPTPLRRLVGEAVESYEPAARAAGVALESEPLPDLLVDADAQRVTQVLFNLIGNALKFTPRGGRVRVAAHREGDHVIVRVSDTGPGLTREQIARLFQPFSQVHDTMQRTQAGAGLGLYISRGIVEQHGGRIWCESAGPALGSVFAFTLPAAAAARLNVSGPIGEERARP